MRNLRRGDHHCYKLQLAANKYGVDKLSFEPILVCDRAELLGYEQAILSHLKPEYNTILLAQAPSQDPVIAEKIAASHRGRKQSPELVQKRANALRGYKHSSDTREKISEALRGRKLTPEQRAQAISSLPHHSGADHYHYGKPISQEMRALLSRVHKGKTVPEDVRRRTSETMKRLGINCGAANPTARSICCIDLNKHFGTVTSAVSWLRSTDWPKAHAGKIRDAIKRDIPVYGHLWRYTDI